MIITWCDLHVYRIARLDIPRWLTSRGIAYMWKSTSRRESRDRYILHDNSMAIGYSKLLITLIVKGSIRACEAIVPAAHRTSKVRISMNEWSLRQGCIINNKYDICYFIETKQMYTYAK